jgi:hypothetical protein
MPNFNFIVPPSPAYLGDAAGSDRVLSPTETPEVYTTTGPLPLSNGLVTTNASLKLDPNSVTEGTFDCGRFGSQA